MEKRKEFDWFVIYLQGGTLYYEVCDSEEAVKEFLEDENIEELEDCVYVVHENKIYTVTKSGIELVEDE